uniref:Uncharacterized protein n=1 Tax=Anopheles atroparvus TaxID=41427 RepID=A0AAG5CZ71_ANOAO
AKLHPARATVCTLPTSSQRKFNALACTPSLVGGFVGNRINAGALGRISCPLERLKFFFPRFGHTCVASRAYVSSFRKARIWSSCRCGCTRLAHVIKCQLTYKSKTKQHSSERPLKIPTRSRKPPHEIPYGSRSANDNSETKPQALTHTQ